MTNRTYSGLPESNQAQPCVTGVSLWIIFIGREVCEGNANALRACVLEISPFALKITGANQTQRMMWLIFLHGNNLLVQDMNEYLLSS